MTRQEPFFYIIFLRAGKRLARKRKEQERKRRQDRMEKIKNKNEMVEVCLVYQSQERRDIACVYEGDLSRSTTEHGARQKPAEMGR